MTEKIFTEVNFESEVLKSALPVLVDFYADWCGPCKLQAPILEEVSRQLEGKALVGKLNIDSSSSIAEKYNIMSIPTLAVFKDGEVKATLVGLQGQETILKEVEKWL